MADSCSGWAAPLRSDARELRLRSLADSSAAAGIRRRYVVLLLTQFKGDKKEEEEPPDSSTNRCFQEVVENSGFTPKLARQKLFGNTNYKLAAASLYAPVVAESTPVSSATFRKICEKEQIPS